MSFQMLYHPGQPSRRYLSCCSLRHNSILGVRWRNLEMMLCTPRATHSKIYILVEVGEIRVTWVNLMRMWCIDGPILDKSKEQTGILQLLLGVSKIRAQHGTISSQIGNYFKFKYWATVKYALKRLLSISLIQRQRYPKLSRQNNLSY